MHLSALHRQQTPAGITACHVGKGHLTLHFSLYAAKIRWLISPMWIAENLLCNVQQIGKNTGAKSCKLVQSEHPPNVSQGLTLYLKACAFELQHHKIWRLSRGQYSFTVFLRNPVTTKWVDWKKWSDCFYELYICAEKKRENLQSSLWVWWDKSLCGEENVQHCLQSTAAKSLFSVNIWGEEHLIWAQQWLSGREEVRLLAFA